MTDLTDSHCRDWSGVCSETGGLGGVHLSQPLLQHILLVQSYLCPVSPLYSSHNIQWMSPESPEKGSEDSVRTVVQQHEGEEDQQDHVSIIVFGQT